MVMPTYAEHVAAVIQNQHSEINKTMQRITMLLGHRPKPSLFGHRMSEIRLLLKLLEEQLAHHFHTEERHGTLKELRETMPRLAGIILKTEKDHPKLLEELDSVGRLAVTLTHPKPGELANMERKFKTFLTHLSRHQGKEDKILQGAYNSDIGVND